MMKSSNLSSRSTFFSSRSMKASSKKKKATKKILTQRTPLSETEILTKKIIHDIIECSIQIADFHIKHKKNQKTYENRQIKKVQNFISKDSLFIGNLPQQNRESNNWTFISKLLGKIIYVETNTNILMIYNFDTNNETPLQFNLGFDEKKIISAELYENEKNMKCILLLLFQDFSFITYDLFSLNQNELEGDEAVYKSKISEFDFKPYLNIPNIDEYFPNYSNGIKIIIFPKVLNNYGADIILNFTQIAGKFLIFNILSNSIIGNYIINQKDYVTTESEYLSKLRNLINVFFTKVWSIKQYECLIQIINSICGDNNSNIYDDLKKLAVLLNMSSNDEGDNLSLLLHTKQYTFTQIKNVKSCKERDIEAEKLYSNILLPILAKSNSDSCIITLKTLLIKIKNFFEKLYGCSIAVGKADLTLIEGKFKVYQNLFLKCYNRDINLRQLFINKDIDNNGYVDKKDAVEIFKDLPIGLTLEEIDELLTKYNIFDENGKYMYEYLFLLDEQIITKIVFSTPLNLLDGNKFTCGYFINSKTTNNIEFNNIKGKMSSPTNPGKGELVSIDTEYDINKNYGNKIQEKCDLTMPEKKFDYEYLLDYIINNCLTIEIADMVIFTSLNLLFIVTPFNQNIPIFKLDTKFSNRPKVLEKIGMINLNSYYNNYPGFLFSIEERNLLITQRTTNKSTELVFIDIRKDLLFPFRDSKEIVYNIVENNIDSNNRCKIVENIITFEPGRKNMKLIKKILYLKKSEIIAIATDEDLYLINPKSHHVEISLKMQEIKKTAYTNICRQFCENPEEETGEDKFKILRKINLNQNLKNIYSFFLGNDCLCNEQYYKYSNTDWILLLFDEGIIGCFCVNSVILNQKAKEIDTPIPEKEKIQIFNFVTKNKLNSLKEYEEEKKSIENSYEKNKLTKIKNIDQISLNIKETMLYQKPFELKRDSFEINSIHQLINLIKHLRLNYNTNQIFEMFPYITFGKLKYETDADYFKTELFPNDKNYQEFGTSIEEMHLPKNKNELKSDLSSLNSHLNIIDSAIKKLAKFIVDKNIPNDYIYKSCVVNNEELLDYDQYVAGLKKMGLFSKLYLNEEEMKIIFKAIDENKSSILTLDEYNRFLEKIDIYSIKSNVEKEAQKKKKETLFDFDIEKFVNSSEEEKLQIINPVLEKVKNFYMNIPDVLFNEIKANIDLIKDKISIDEINNRFNQGFIFYEDFHDLMYELIPSIKEEEINKLFAYFDQNNMNLFIYVRDFIKYLNQNNNTLDIINNNIEETGQIKKYMTDEQFILIWIGLMKKILKLCILDIGIFPEEFSEKYIFLKKYNNHLIVLNYIPSEIAIEKIKKKITNFLPLEEKILFENYLDYYNYGILYYNSFKEILDNMMKYINDSDLFDLTKFDTFDLDNANQYINVRKHNINKNEKILEKNFMENLLPIYDKVIMKFAFYTQSKSGMKNLTFLYNYLREIGEEKDFLTHKEFMKILKDFIPQRNFNAKFAQNLISQLTENVKLINEPIRPVISISRIILFIINVVKKSQFLEHIVNTQELDFIENKIILENCNRCICTLNQYNSVMNEINKLSEDYLKIIEDNSYSGLIILNKTLTIDHIMDYLTSLDSVIFDYCNYYMNLGNNILVQNFNKLIKSRSILNSDEDIPLYNNSLPQNFLSQIEIPEVKINVINLKDMMNLKKYQSGMIENFDFFQPELHCVVNVTKIRKSFLLKHISKDGNNLLNYILDCLKLNHFLQQNYLSKSLTKPFDNFLFLRNFGISTKEITINKILEEELYIINEKIDEKEFISLQSLIRTNGGLFFIPEIFDTGMGIFILRSWGKFILNTIQELNKVNRCFKYFNSNDFYGSYNGKKLKMANIFSISLFNENGEMTFGPDVAKILMLLDKLPTGVIDELTFDKMENIYLNDAYIAPEIIKKINLETPSNKVDSWLYGVLLFHILFGVTPESFYSQLKKYCDNYLENCNMEQVLIDDEFDVLKTNFFYNPFNNIKVIMEDKFYFTKILRGNSFSAIIKSKYNIKSKDKYSYDISEFIDLINACLNIDPEKRPSISDLINFNLFEIPFDLQERFSKTLSNVMEYYSPDSVIKEKIVIPLRKICCDVMRNQETKPIVINNYQNYILSVINDLNVYMFQKFDNLESNLDNDNRSLSSTENSYDNRDEFMEENSEFKFKNTVLIKYVVEYKVIDLLIFLVLRHFNTNLKLYKQKIKYESNEEEKNNNSTGSSNVNIFPTNTNFDNLIETSNAVLNTNATLTERNTNKRYYEELNNNYGKLISALVEFLRHCVQALNDYNNILCLYVENVLIWILKLFVGEENQLLGCKYDYKVSNDRIKQYIINRTFMRHENIVIKDDFEEDDVDLLFSVLNLNKNLIDEKSYWSPELYYFINPLFREAFGENCSGNYHYRMIKNYFLVVNNTSGNTNKVNPLSDNGDTVKKIYIPETKMEIEIKNNFLNTEYVSEVFTIVDILKQLSNKQLNHKKNVETKRKSLNYLNIVLKSKNSSKIRGCLDCKFHLIIQKYLFTSTDDIGIKKDLFNILKEISLSLVDMNEISWQFGNNYEKIYEKKNNSINKIPSNINIDLENNSCVNDSNWDSNTSLIDFTNNILIQPHLYMLNYSNKFLKVNIQKSFSTYHAHMKEFGYIFSSPLILKPIMRCLIRRNENYFIRQTCLEILFNILLSNEIRITSNLNMTMCNFYELLIEIVSLNKNDNDWEMAQSGMTGVKDDFDFGEKEKYFMESVSKVIKIIIEMQNPDIKRQIFNCPIFLKYMEKNKLSFIPRLELEEIEEEFNKIKDLLNFENLEGKIIFLIDAFKVWVYENKLNSINENLPKIRNIMISLHHIFNNEWNNGLKSSKKNCLIFNIVKLYEWIIVYDHREFLFPKNSESFTSTIIISFMSKIKDNSETMKNIAKELNRMVNTSNLEKNKNKYGINLFADSSYTLNKMNNYISLKLLNIIYSIFYLGDNYYNAIFNKLKIGLLISELFINQLETLSLFLNLDNIDISILNNYMAEVKIRLGFIESISSLPKNFDDIKMQFLQSDFINYIFKYMIDDIRYFRTNSKKLTLEFMQYKNSFPLRNEAMAFLDIIFRKYYNVQKRTETDCFIFDEIIRNVKVFHLVQNQLTIIKTKIKGNEVLSVLGFFNMVLKNNEREIIKIMNSENAKDYFIYALQKETHLKKLFPLVVEYISKLQAGIEK